MNITDKVAVCSRSFSANPLLRSELLARYQNVTFNDAGVVLEGDTLVSFLRGHDKAITALERIDEYMLSRLPELKVIGKYGVGLDMIDFSAMRRHGKRLGWTGGVNRRAVSELALSLAIAMLRHVPLANREVLSGTWRQHVGGLLSGRTIGIIGCGHVGKDLVRLLQPFNCRIFVNDIRSYAKFYAEFSIEAVKLNELLVSADVVTLHVPLDESTRNILSEDRLSLMKPHTILINTARGGLVDEGALKRALLDKRLAAAAFDVFVDEPPQDLELINLKNFLATPHIGGSSEEAILAMGKAAIEGLDKSEIPHEL
ncbi:D-isomer specific 2-hydroxyacid dehydrogenase, NAD-binding [uncultured Woeseiaceae bacterium]|uniref:D-isomer specific 2-hydroxyacid dehydrogenase, NAD-binding n=1 Tax=uncultured Woeseiaceae bacterium TaxID=1983305 RepID=A0A7D9D1Y0_9GAMM|nr:D-isomer specific 2-hydroxyacid dehydrogenase, NAD-binding [uncultured Woeseiaceae bacterium]